MKNLGDNFFFGGTQGLEGVKSMNLTLDMCLKWHGCVD